MLGRGHLFRAPRGAAARGLTPIAPDAPLLRRSGQFYGRGEAARQAAGLGFARLAATTPEEEVRTHTHEDAHFVLALSGVYLSTARSAPPLACAPFLVFNPAGVTHRDRFLHGQGRFVALTVPRGVEGGLIADAPRLGPAVRLHDPYALHAARLIARELGGPCGDFALEALAMQLFGSLVPDRARANQPPAWLARAHEMIWEADDPELSVATVAREVGVHPVHLARVFRRYLGCAPGEYLRGRRLERAASLLGRARASLAEVAAETGFVDQSHLHRAFRSAFGVTPGRYRRRGGGEDVAPIQDRRPRRS